MKHRAPELAALAIVCSLKLAHALAIRSPGAQAEYFSELAAHVRDGHGLVTNVSLFHQGFEQFPHPSPASPLWPLLYGFAARFMPLDVAGALLATLCWGLAVALSFLLAERIFTREAPLPRFPWLRCSHLLAFLLATDAAFFHATSAPLAQGLAVVLALAGALWARRCWRAPTLVDGFVSGALLGALLLTDRAFAPLVAIFLSFEAGLFLFMPERGKRLTAIAVCASALVASLVPHLLRLSEWTLGSPWLALLRVELARERDLLSTVPAPMEAMPLLEIALVFGAFVAWTQLAQRMPAAAVSLFLVATVASIARTSVVAKELVESEEPPYSALAGAIGEVRARATAGTVIVAVQAGDAERLAARAPGPGIHAVYEATTAEDVRALERLGVCCVLLDSRRSAGWPVRRHVENGGWTRREAPGGFELFEREGSRP